MRTRRFYHLPGGATDPGDFSFQWVHVYPGKPVPPTHDGSFNYLLWELLQQRYPDHLLIARYDPASLDLVQDEDAPIVYIEYTDRIRMRDRVKQLLANIPPNVMRDFIEEACRCIAATNVENVMLWGSMAPLPFLRRAFPSKTIAFAQRYYEIPWASAGYYGYCDYLLTQTEGTARAIFEKQSAVQPTIVTIPNGVDLDRFRPALPEEKLALRAQLGLPAGKTIVLFPSKLARNKGTSYLYNWIRHCRRTLPELYFVVAGAVAAPLTGDTRDLVELLRCANNARWLQGIPRREMHTWYRAADLSLMPGVWREGMSMAALESLAAGLPLIATKRGIYPEIVFHHYNGWLCRPEALYREGLEAMETLARNEELRKRLSQNARAYATKRLDRRRCLENFRAFFEGRFLDICADLSV